MRPTLKFDTVIRYEVDYDDLNAFLQKVYNNPNIDVVVDMEWNNGESHGVRVSMDEPNEWDAEKLESLRQGKSVQYYSLHSVLNDCCRQNLIPPGDYLVHASW